MKAYQLSNSYVIQLKPLLRDVSTVVQIYNYDTIMIKQFNVG